VATTIVPTTASTSTSTPDSTPTTPSTESPLTDEIVDVYFGIDDADCGAVAAYQRQVPAGVGVDQFAFEALLAGPTAADLEAGAISMFSNETVGMVRSVTRTGETLHVDFADLRTVIPNASTSCGSEALLSQLNSTAFALEGVERVGYSIFGSCSVMFEWLQRECTEYTPEGGVTSGIDTNRLASGSGCMPGAGELPDGRWFGTVVDRSVGSLSFDLACIFGGQAAIDAATEDGEESPPPNDYYIRNANDTLRELSLDADSLTVMLLDELDLPNSYPVTYNEWRELDFPFGPPAFWITIEDGQITDAQEQYFP